MAWDATMQRADRTLIGAGPSDEVLVERIRAGERALFEILMRRHNQRIYRALRGLLRDEGEIEDAMQQAYLQAWSRLDTFHGEARFSTWLIRIALNEGLMRLRKQRRLELVPEPESPEDEMPTAAPDPQDRAERRELAEVLSRAVDALPETYRVGFVLREVEGLSTAEVASALGITEDAVKTRLYRARSLLRDALFERLGAHAGELFTFGAARCDRIVEAVLRKIDAG
jgi:RNA polymerase sigma-70 factor (ECF subfamily)